VFLSFREEYCKTTQDVSFSLSNALLEFQDSSSQDFGRRGNGRRLEKFRVFESKKGQSTSILGIRLCWIGGRDELPETVGELGVDNARGEIFCQEKGNKWYMVATRRLKEDEWFGVVAEHGEESLKALLRLRKFALFKYLSVNVQEAIRERVLGNVNSHVHHETFSPLSGLSSWGPLLHPPLWQGFFYPTNLLGVEGHGDRLLTRLESLRSMEFLSLFLDATPGIGVT